MKDIYNIDDISLDINQLRYDLALIYAKCKFNQALTNNTVPCTDLKLNSLEFLDETDYLNTLFGKAYNEYTTYDKNYFIQKIDPTIEQND